MTIELLKLIIAICHIGTGDQHQLPSIDQYQHHCMLKYAACLDQNTTIKSESQRLVICMIEYDTLDLTKPLPSTSSHK